MGWLDPSGNNSKVSVIQTFLLNLKYISQHQFPPSFLQNDFKLFQNRIRNGLDLPKSFDLSRLCFCLLNRLNFIAISLYCYMYMIKIKNISRFVFWIMILPCAYLLIFQCKGYCILFLIFLNFWTAFNPPPPPAPFSGKYIEIFSKKKLWQKSKTKNYD